GAADAPAPPPRGGGGAGPGGGPARGGPRGRRRGVDVVDAPAGALGGEPAGQRGADAAATAGHHHARTAYRLHPGFPSSLALDVKCAASPPPCLGWAHPASATHRRAPAAPPARGVGPRLSRPRPFSPPHTPPPPLST